MKNSSHNYLKKLRQYSLLTAPLLAGVTGSSAQIIYTDVSPDSIIKSDPGTFSTDSFDVNNDGVFDFLIGVDHTPNNYSFDAAAVRLYTDNGIDGIVGYTSGGFFNMFSALNSGAPIGPQQNFVRPFPYYGTLFFQYTNGYGTFGQWINETDKYMGFRLQEIDGLHYGWMRMNVFTDPPEIVVKDYAINAVPETGIAAGAKTIDCTDLYENNNHNSEAAPISVNTTITANISDVLDRDWYSFHVNPDANNLQIVLSDLPANYNMGLFHGSTRVAYANHNRKTNDTIVINDADKGDYKLEVASINGKFSAEKCYSFIVRTSSSPFKLNNEEVTSHPTIAVYPSPASDFVNVSTNGFNAEISQVVLTDQFGKILYEVTSPVLNNNLLRIEASHLASGIYFLTVTANKSVTVSKVSIVH